MVAVVTWKCNSWVWVHFFCLVFNLPPLVLNCRLRNTEGMEVSAQSRALMWQHNMKDKGTSSVLECWWSWRQWVILFKLCIIIFWIQSSYFIMHSKQNHTGVFVCMYLYLFLSWWNSSQKKAEWTHRCFLWGAGWYCLLCRHAQQHQGLLCSAQGKNKVRLGSFLLNRYGKQLCAHFEYVNTWGGMKQFPFKWNDDFRSHRTLWLITSFRRGFSSLNLMLLT